jgi:hypothetical protein
MSGSRGEGKPKDIRSSFLDGEDTSANAAPAGWVAVAVRVATLNLEEELTQGGLHSHSLHSLHSWRTRRPNILQCSQWWQALNWALADNASVHVITTRIKCFCQSSMQGRAETESVCTKMYGYVL